jgi:hypothetical protein
MTDSDTNLSNHLSTLNISDVPAIAPSAPTTFSATQEATQFRWEHVPEFHGHSNKVEEFLIKLDIFFSMNPSFKLESQKTLYVISRLKGRAFDWIIPRKAACFPEWTRDHQILLDDLKHQFGDQQSKSMASSKVMRLRQGKRSVSDFAIEMETLFYKAGWDPNSQPAKTAFENGLNDDILGALSHDAVPESFREYVNLAVTLEQRLRNGRRINENRSVPSSRRPTFQPNGVMNNNQSIPNNFQRTAQPTQSDGPVPMEVDAIQRNSRGLTAAERQFRIANNLCLYCGNQGHRASNCPNKRNSTFVAATLATDYSNPHFRNSAVSNEYAAQEINNSNAAFMGEEDLGNGSSQ